MKDLLARQIPPELYNVVAFGTLDVDSQEHHDICGQHKILNLPSLALYRDGSLIQIVASSEKSVGNRYAPMGAGKSARAAREPDVG
jgi:hypothetical protein